MAEPVILSYARGLLSEFPGVPEGTVDVIPVDMVAAGMLLATAAILDGSHEQVYQLGASDVNRVTSRRLTELTGLAVRAHWRKKADAGEDAWKNRIKVRLEGRRVSQEEFDRFSAPMMKKLADGAIKLIDDKLPRWGAPRLEALAARAKDELTKISRFTGQVIELTDLFKPFNYDRDVTFRCDRTRALWQRVTPEDQQRLWWAPETLNWRDYWIGTHFAGLQEWVFPTLDDEFGPKPRSVYTYKDLLELWEATTKLHKNRVALRIRPKVDDDVDPRDVEPVVYTYGRIADLALVGAAQLRQRGAAGVRHAVIVEHALEQRQADQGAERTTQHRAPAEPRPGRHAAGLRSTCSMSARVARGGSPRTQSGHPTRALP